MMKQTPQLQKIQENMRPGVITLDGFLGRDTRNLVDILIDDDARVKRLGYTHKVIALKMVDARDKGKRGLGDFISVEPHFEIKVDSVRGKLPCPFGDPGVFPKVNTTVRNLSLGKEITFTDLHIHFILVHGFYEGKGSAYRLEPEDLVAILEVEKPENGLSIPGLPE